MLLPRNRRPSFLSQRIQSLSRPFTIEVSIRNRAPMAGIGWNKCRIIQDKTDMMRPICIGIGKYCKMCFSRDTSLKILACPDFLQGVYTWGFFFHFSFSAPASFLLVEAISRLIKSCPFICSHRVHPLSINFLYST